MKHFSSLPLLLSILVGIIPHVAESSKVIGAGEQVLEPPFLQYIWGAKQLNVYSPEGKSRSIVAGDLFRFGDRVRTQKKAAFHVFFSENCWLVLQGGSEITVGKARWSVPDHPYGIMIPSGWVKAECPFQEFEVANGAQAIRFNKFKGWIETGPSTIHIYLESGSYALKDGGWISPVAGQYKLDSGQDWRNLGPWFEPELRQRLGPIVSELLFGTLQLPNLMKDEKFFDSYRNALKNKWQKPPKLD